METILSTSTKLIVNLTDKIRLCGQRHSDRRTGSSVWETWFELYGKWKVYNNPFDRKDYTIQVKWGVSKANTYKGIKLAKRWNYKKEIIEALNNITKQGETPA